MYVDSRYKFSNDAELIEFVKRYNDLIINLRKKFQDKQNIFEKNLEKVIQEYSLDGVFDPVKFSEECDDEDYLTRNDKVLSGLNSFYDDSYTWELLASKNYKYFLKKRTDYIEESLNEMGFDERFKMELSPDVFLYFSKIPCKGQEYFWMSEEIDKNDVENGNFVISYYDDL